MHNNVNFKKQIKKSLKNKYCMYIIKIIVIPRQA